jgi:tetratricopeptide (TPR) repeat protein
VRIREGALRAIELDDSLAVAHSLAAKIALYEDWDWNAADREFSRAIALDPSDAGIRLDYGLFLLNLRRWEAAAGEFDHARRLDPLNATYVGVSSLPRLAQGQFEAAISDLRASVTQNPGLVPFHMFLWGALANIGRFSEALEEARQFHALLGNADAVAALDGADAGQVGYQTAMRRAAAAMDARSSNQYVSPVWIAQLYATAGETERALTWLERAFEERNPALPGMRGNLFWTALTDEPRFQNIVRAMRFPE